MQSRLRANIGWKEIWKASIPGKGNVEKYESSFASKFENRFAAMFSHGRTALYALFKVWGLEDDEIICPAYTCVVVQHAIVLSGNIPVFVDAAKDSFNMDIDLLEKAIHEKTKAIVVTHLFGYPMDVKRIQDIVEKAEQKYGHKIYVIQDCAHSYGARFDGELVTKYGDASIFGSNVSKIITSIFGGIATTNDLKTYQGLLKWRTENCRQLRFKGLQRWVYLIASTLAFIPLFYSIVYRMIHSGLLNRFVKYYQEDTITFPGDWDALPCDTEARVGLVQLDKYDKIVEARVNNAKVWIKKHKDEITFFEDINGSTYSHCVALVDDRPPWINNYAKKGIELGILIEYCVPNMKAFQKYNRGEKYPNAEYFSEHTINFPVWRGVKF